MAPYKVLLLDTLTAPEQTTLRHLWLDLDALLCNMLHTSDLDLWYLTTSKIIPNNIYYPVIKRALGKWRCTYLHVVTKHDLSYYLKIIQEFSLTRLNSWIIFSLH